MTISKPSGTRGTSWNGNLVRLLFCLFADDTGIFTKDSFHRFIAQRTAEDGSDLAGWLANLFHVLNKPEAERLRNLDDHWAAFPYVNGKLFEEPLSRHSSTGCESCKARRRALLNRLFLEPNAWIGLPD